METMERVVILGLAGYENAGRKLRAATAADAVTVAETIGALLERGLLQPGEPGEDPWPTLEAEADALTDWSDPT
jgi:hypothetical protein